MSDIERTIAAYHEAGHATAAVTVGRRVEAVTIVQGAVASGACLYERVPVRVPAPEYDGRPFSLWPPEWRDAVTSAAIVTAAGRAAEGFVPARLVLGDGRHPVREPRPGREPRLRREPAAVPDGLSDSQREDLAAAVDDPDLETDDRRLLLLAEAAFGTGDALRGVRRSWLAHVGHQADAILAYRRDALERLATLLLVHGVAGEPVIAACLAGR